MLALKRAFQAPRNRLPAAAFPPERLQLSNPSHPTPRQTPRTAPRCAPRSLCTGPVGVMPTADSPPAMPCHVVRDMRGVESVGRVGCRTCGGHVHFALDLGPAGVRDRHGVDRGKSVILPAYPLTSWQASAVQNLKTA
eukprot:352963-Chlamydomonas_euryale.AAC.3